MMVAYIDDHKDRFGVEADLCRVADCQCRSKFPQLCRSKNPHFLEVLFHSGLFFFGGRPRRFLGFAGAVMGGSRKFSGTSLACSLSR